MTRKKEPAPLRAEDLAQPLPAPAPPDLPPPPGDEDAPGGGTPAPLRILDPAGWGEEDPPPMRYLLEGLLPLGAPAILAAMSNAGKSLLGMMISFAVAVGWPLFGRRGPEEPMKALFVEMEDDPDEIRRRYRRCRDLFREDPGWGESQEALLKANWRAAVPDWASATPKSITALLPWLQAHAEQLCRDGGHVGLVILDTYAALAEGEENKAEVQRDFWGACYALAASTGGTPLVVHHVRKPAAGARGKNAPSMAERLSFDTLRGSSAIVAGARAILQAEPLTPDEAGKLNLDAERAGAGNYLVLALTKTVSGPKGAWIALEQREAWENGAGFFVPLAGGDKVCAALRGKAAAASFTLAETLLLSIADGCEDRQELARRHWPGEKAEKADTALKSQLSHLRSKYGWLQKGRGFLLTAQGFARVQELRRSRGDFAGDFTGHENGELSNDAGSKEVSRETLNGTLTPDGTGVGSPAEPQERQAPLVPGRKVPKSHSPRRGDSGDFETFGEVI